MNLQYEKGSFKNKETNEIINYIKYYVVLLGVKVYLKPSDQTSKALLESQLVNK